jgi:hypothetical protein
VDDTWLKEADHGTKIPAGKLEQAGYGRGPADALRKVAKEEDVVFGSRVTNVDSLKHPDAIPKPVGVKGKTIQDLDVRLGAKEGDQGLAGMFEPTHPGDDASRELLDRCNQRLAEFDKLKTQLPALEGQGIFWDEVSGLFKNADGVPYRGDIDLVYIKDAKTGELITGERYDQIIERLRESGAEVQHGAEQSVIRDIVRDAGDDAFESAAKLQADLSSAHRPTLPDGGSWAEEAGSTQTLPSGAAFADEAGSSWGAEAGSRTAVAPAQETVIETSAEGWVKGAQPRTIAERVIGPNPLEAGLPREMPDGSLFRP